MADHAFMKSLFHGVLAENMVFPYPELSAQESDTVHRLLDSVRRFCGSHLDATRIDREARIPPEVFDGLRGLGLFGMTVPNEYGGAGLSHSAYARVIQEVAGYDASVALTLGAHQSIGLRGLILFGSEELKRRYLPELATGETIAAFALTEPGAGSDASAIQTHAELSEDGSHYKLNGSKIWITNGGMANVFTVFARTSPRQEGIKPKITAFLVERGMGVATGPNEHKLGIRGASTTPVFFDDVSVPSSHILGEPGRGFRIAVEILNDGRLSLASGCVGVCKRLLKLALDRTQERRAFGRPIGEFGLIKDKIASMMAETYALESMVYLTTGMTDSGNVDNSIESAICKVYGSEALWRIVNETLQIAAGIGFMQDYPYERLLRDSRINLIFDGTNEILRCFIALSGMQDAGRELAEVARAMREPIKGFGLLSDFALRKARSALGRERFTRAHPSLQREAALVEEYTADLARMIQKTLRAHGTNLSEMQYTQKRVADVAIELYALTAVISRTTRAIERRGEEGARREIDLTACVANTAQRRLAELMTSFESNDDELRKTIAGRAYADGAYPFDIL